MIRGLLALVLTVVLTATVHAHSQSYGYLTVTDLEQSLSGRLDVAVRDADLLLALDSDASGTITWGEVQAREHEIGARLLGGIGLARGETPCTLEPSPLLIDEHGGETYLAIPFAASCTATGPVSLGYDLLFDRDAQHRGIVSYAAGGPARTVIMSPDNREAVLAASGAASRFATFVAHGIHHIWIGYDHILFLMTLLLATAMRARGQGARRSLVAAAKVVTAFTVSHSVTLTLAATSLVSVPAAVTESLIALTIALAAANNIWPVVTARVWILALLFGLVHGLGFANVLADLGLDSTGLLVTLLAFNIGVELGQLAIVIVALPVIHAAAAPRLGWKTMPAANAAIIALGLAWFSDRALGTALLPF